MQYPPINRTEYDKYVKQMAVRMPRTKAASYEDWANVRRTAKEAREIEAAGKKL